jgi:thymidylate synthase
MYISAATLDDLLRRVFQKLLQSKNRVTPTRGEATELTGTLLRITNPRARLSSTERKGKIFSSLGELLWYLAGTNNLRFISYYLRRYKDDSEDGRTIYGGYGPRLFDTRGQDQIANVLKVLKQKSASRRAVIQLFNAEDISEARREIPCTCILQFMIRAGRLHMVTYMRSNDAFLGLPHDVFAFTMLQEIIARSLSVELGTYKHAVGSLHLYAKDIDVARQYLDEGWQPTIQMPEMPRGDPWPSVTRLLTAESAIRRGKPVEIEALDLDPYWADLARLLLIYKHSKDNKGKDIARVRRNMSSDMYSAYIAKRQAAAIPTKERAQKQLPLAVSS